MVASRKSRKIDGRRPSLLDGRPEFAQEMQNHSGNDISCAEHWSDILKDKELQKDPATAERFYAELKLRLLRKFGTVAQAFKEIDAAGDGSINFGEWSTMLQLMHLPLESRAARWIFGCASGGAKEIELEQLKVILMQPTLKKIKAFLQSYKSGQDRVNRHMQLFLAELTEPNHEIAIASVDRFQRRMKLPFCREIYSKTITIHSVDQQMQSKCIQHVTLDPTTFYDMLVNSAGVFVDRGLLLESQIPLLMNIVARTGNSLVDFMAALAILSTDVDRSGKLQMMFEVFDTDRDTVLADHQLKDLFCLICKIRPLLQSSSMMKLDNGGAFQDELSEQEGLRCYECARWRLHRGGNNEGTVNWSELWGAIKDQPDVMTSLLPASPPVHWALNPPAQVHGQDWPPRAVTPLEKNTSHGKRPGNHHSRITGARPTSRSPSRGSRVRLAETQGNTWKPQLTEFEKDLTERFQRRLRRLGHQRVSELQEALENPTGRASGASPRASDGDTHGAVDVLSSVSFQPSTTQSGMRTSLSLPRLSSRGSTLKGMAHGGQRNSLARVSTAPNGLRGSMLGKCASAGSGGGTTGSSRIDKLPLVDSLTLENALKWGAEAADRHRLVVEAQMIAEQDPLECGHHNGQSTALLDTFPYNCQLCERKHALNPKEKHE